MINSFKTLDLKKMVKVIEAIQKIISLVNEVLGDVITCSVINQDGTDTMNKLKKFDINKRSIVIISHFGQLISDFQSLINIAKHYSN